MEFIIALTTKKYEIHHTKLNVIGSPTVDMEQFSQPFGTRKETSMYSL